MIAISTVYDRYEVVKDYVVDRARRPKSNAKMGLLLGEKMAEICDYETNCIMYLGI